MWMWQSNSVEMFSFNNNPSKGWVYNRLLYVFCLDQAFQFGMFVSVSRVALSDRNSCISNEKKKFKTWIFSHFRTSDQSQPAVGVNAALSVFGEL